MSAGHRFRVVLGEAQRRAIASGEMVCVALGGEAKVLDVRATSALVGRVDGAWRAFANVCRHRAIPLDVGADTPMAADKKHLLCHQHGALYRQSDGLCVAGPCVGERLAPMTVDEDGVALLLSSDG